MLKEPKRIIAEEPWSPDYSHKLSFRVFFARPFCIKLQKLFENLRVRPQDARVRPHIEKMKKLNLFGKFSKENIKIAD